MSISPEVRSAFNNILDIDSAGGYHQLAYYLKSIICNRPISIEAPGINGLVEIPADEAWQLIQTWSTDNEANLPMGDRGTRARRATRLLSYLELNVQGKAREAAAAHQAILESVRTAPLKNLTPPTPAGASLKKMLELRDAQYKLLQDKYLGKLETAIQQTAFLKRFKSDPYTYSILSGLLAANSANLINQPNNAALADEIARLTQYHGGNGSLNNAAHLAYAREIAQKGGELDQLIRTIQDVTENTYGDNAKGRKAYREDIAKLTSLTHLVNVSHIPELVNLIAPAASTSDKQKLSQALRSSIVGSTDNDYVSPSEILTRAANISGVPESQLTHLERLTPLIEEVRFSELHNTITGGLREQDPKIYATLNLSADTGVSAHIPWLKNEDIDARAVLLINKYGLKDGESFKNRIDQELAKGADADFVLISELSKQISDQEQYRYYQQSLSSNGLYYLRDKLGKAQGIIRSATQPAERFYERTNTHIYNIQETLNRPFNSVGDWLIDIQNKFPVLNPAKYINDKITGAQLWVAGQILDWSSKLASKTTSSGSKVWYAGIFQHISDFSGAFIHSEAQWSEASFHFIQIKFGNVLDWGAKKAGYASFQAVKAKVGTTIWNGFVKIAPGMASKINTGAFAKIIASFTLGELTAGTSILLQVAGTVVWEGLKGVWKFFTDSGWRARFIDNLPVYALAGSLISGLATIPGLIIGGAIALGSAIVGGLSAISTALLSLFIPAMITAGILLGSALLINQSLQTTARLDVGTALTQLVSEILCDEESAGAEVGTASSTPTRSSVASCAECLVKYLNACYGAGRTLTGPLVTSNIGCLVAAKLAPDVVDAIQRSAVGYNWLQCIGFARASARCGGNDLPGQPVASGYITGTTPGYKFTQGAQWCQPGDFGIIDGVVGHIFVVKLNNGGTITGIDANYVDDGVVSNNTPFPSSMVAGCLKKL